MRLILTLLFIGVPIAEIALLISVGGWIGVLPTIALIVFTAVAGAHLLRSQGLSVLRQAQSSLDQGDLPVDSVIDGVFLLVAGVLLLTPGLITDAFGFLLFIPGLRRAVASQVFTWIKESDKIHVDIRGPGGSQRPAPDPDGPVIEGEFTRDDPPEEPATPEDAPKHDDKGSPWQR